MALPPLFRIMSALAWDLLHWAGAIGLLLVLLIMVGPKIPFIKRKLADWHFAHGMMAFGGPYGILVRDEDGYWELLKAELDRVNEVVYAIHSDGHREPFDVEGVEEPGHLHGMRTFVAYRGLGQAKDIAHEEIDVESVIIDPGFKTPSPSRLSILNGWFGDISGVLSRGDDQQPVADGGAVAGQETREATIEEIRDVLEEVGYLRSLGKKVVVDLRDTLYNAPAHVRPWKFHTVAKNAQNQDKVFLGGMKEWQFLLLVILSFLGSGALVYFAMGGPSG